MKKALFAVFALFGSVLTACPPGWRGTPTPIEVCEEEDTVAEQQEAEDRDGDGYAVEDGDCDDGNSFVNPGAWEACHDGLDNDCDGVTEGQGDKTYVFHDYPDVDGFGQSYVREWSCAEGYLPPHYVWSGTDCDNESIWVNPGAIEFGDGLDNDCDGQIDENVDTFDHDGDGYTESDGDCDDRNSDAHPGARENPFEPADEDCDGRWTDYDGDGWDVFSSPLGECNDYNAAAYYEAPEICDGFDNDCDRQTDEDVVDCPSAQQDDDDDGYTEIDGDCNDKDSLVNPGALEICDGLDNDCGLFYNEGFESCTVPIIDLDWDGWSTEEGDCIDYDETVYPGAPEILDGLDNDCDGAAK